MNPIILLRMPPPGHHPTNIQIPVFFMPLRLMAFTSVGPRPNPELCHLRGLESRRLGLAALGGVSASSPPQPVPVFLIQTRACGPLSTAAPGASLPLPSVLPHLPAHTPVRDAPLGSRALPEKPPTLPPLAPCMPTSLGPSACPSVASGRSQQLLQTMLLLLKPPSLCFFSLCVASCLL